jgi:diguanylate cyclase (GGDEF)-like protein
VPANVLKLGAIAAPPWLIAERQRRNENMRPSMLLPERISETQGSWNLEREIARATRTAQPLVLAFVDVDHLKVINDSRGHAAGDRMLVEAVNTLRANLRTYDLIIRYGGDEFICTISGVNVAAATKRFALVNPALAEEPEHGSVTVGLAALRAEDSPEDLIARADAALYRKRRRQRTTRRAVGRR